MIVNKKNNDGRIKDIVKSTISAVGDAFISKPLEKAVTEIKQEFEETVEQTKKMAERVADHIAAKALSFFMVVIGILIAFTGLSLFMIEQGVRPSTAIILVGALLIFLGWIPLSINSRKKLP